MASKTRRRGWGKIRRLPSGRFQASYVHGPRLVRHNAPTTFSTRIDAEGWLARERRLIELDTWTPPAQRVAERQAKAVTVAEYSRRWIDGRNIKERSKIHYRSILDKHIARTALGSVPMNNLTPETVRTWYTGLDSRHPRIKAHAYGLLHAVCASAIKPPEKLIDTNPCQIERAMKTPRKRQPVVLDVPDVARLADAIRPERFKAFILISAWCGLRWGEVIELRCKDIGRDCQIISVSRGVTHRDGCRIDTPKSGKGRTVVVPPHIRAHLEHQLKTHVANDPEALLFAPTRGGCHLNDKVFREYFAAALEKIGCRGVRVHDLRHFAGTQTARVGNLVETMTRLGHSTVQASLIYQGIVSGRDSEIAEALSQLATRPDA